VDGDYPRPRPVKRKLRVSGVVADPALLGDVLLAARREREFEDLDDATPPGSE
jgi:hypothetical protein